MEYILEYGDEEYLIFLNDFNKTDKAEVISIPYSDKEDDCIEYEIQIFIRKANGLSKIKVMELSDTLREIIGRNIQEILDRTFIANPYFDELLVFYGNKVFTYQDQYKPLKCTECEKINLYEKRNKGNKTEYIEEIKKLMEGNKNSDWPFKENLLLQFSVSDTQSRLDEIDLDNLAKTIFDIFKGVVYDNDSQIISFAGEKHSILNRKAFMVAIKRLESDENPVFQEYLYSSKMNSWKEERKQKELLKKPTYFRMYRKISKDEI